MTGIAGSQTVTVSTPPPGDEDVLFSYLKRLHNALHADGQPSVAAARLRTAELMHARVADLVVMDIIFQSISLAVSDVDAEAQSYIKKAASAGEKPDLQRLKLNYQHKQEILRRTQDELELMLGRDRWREVQGYIDDEFRFTIRRTGYSWTKTQ